MPKYTIKNRITKEPVAIVATSFDEACRVAGWMPGDCQQVSRDWTEEELRQLCAYQEARAHYILTDKVDTPTKVTKKITMSSDLYQRCQGYIRQDATLSFYGNRAFAVLVRVALQHYITEVPYE